MSDIEYSFSADNPKTTSHISEDGVDVSSSDSNPVEIEVSEKDKNEETASGDASTPAANAAKDGDGTGEPDANAEAGDKQEDDGQQVELNVIEKFDPEDQENVAQWNKEYANEDGTFKLERFSDEFWANYKDGEGKAELNAQTYDYLKSKGWAKSDVDRVIADLLNARAYEKDSLAKHDDELFTLAGGPDQLQSALNWATEGAYSESQQQKFDAIMKGTDLEAKKEAVELLMARFSKIAPAKPTEPKRDATHGEGKPGGNTVKPFASKDQWRKARREAGGDINKLRIVDQRAKVSGF